MKKSSIEDVYELSIPKIISPEEMGALSFIEKKIIPFPIKRVYYLYDVPKNGKRGGHAHKNLFQVLIALNGSFELLLDDGTKTKTIILNTPNIGLYIPNGIWRDMNNFSKNSVCLVLASEDYDEEDYIRNYLEFKKTK
ncbi:FdtA/QdtA family cupin domain-containing protein [Flavobacteriaceae bacterium]|nr:FdtA/QdtA family cupin domain-containing protein [Flavobacteriaceae bacterium]